MRLDRLPSKANFAGRSLAQLCEKPLLFERGDWHFNTARGTSCAGEHRPATHAPHSVPLVAIEGNRRRRSAIRIDLLEPLHAAFLRATEELLHLPFAGPPFNGMSIRARCRSFVIHNLLLSKHSIRQKRPEDAPARLIRWALFAAWPPVKRQLRSSRPMRSSVAAPETSR